MFSEQQIHRCWRWEGGRRDEMILHSGVSLRRDGWKRSAGLGVRGSLSEALGGLQSGAPPVPDGRSGRRGGGQGAVFCATLSAWPEIPDGGWGPNLHCSETPNMNRAN